MKEWLTGRNPVYEALIAQRRQAFQLLVAKGSKNEGHFDEILQIARQRKIPLQTVDRERLERIGDHNQGLALEVSGYPYEALEDLIAFSQNKKEAPFFVLLDLIQDPQNLGSLLRSAEVFGVHGVVIPSANAAQINQTVVHASSGATEHLHIAQYNLAQAIERLKKLPDTWVYGLDGNPKSKFPASLNLNGGVVLVVGNEGAGLRDLVRKNCDELMKLPMYGKVDSLNAAAAGSIALYLARAARALLPY
ncbi:MAG: 23S rRNA (guanosine(2251)-2'-O)-methyltransferase RlmB [Anaerolineaceae bacterium]|nr:23S rRNA (guanosine(2251)-2'-O)-methyltransferase RlmB [Anaerolineaceae bacterium]